MQTAPSQPPRGQAGFTLLEVLVAFTLLSIVLGTAYASFGSGLRSSQRAMEVLEALSVAESAMDAVGTTLPIRLGRRILDRGGWAISLSVERASGLDGLALPLGAPVPFAVRVAVAHSDDPEDALVVLESLRLAHKR